MRTPSKLPPAERVKILEGRVHALASGAGDHFPRDREIALWAAQDALRLAKLDLAAESK